MAGLTFTWTLRYQGWAFCTVADDLGRAEAVASDITYGPEHLLRAVTSLGQGAASGRADFEAEPTTFRWFLHRDGSEAQIRLVRVPDRGSPDSDGSVIWSGRHSIDVLAWAILDGFDQAVSELGEDNYRAAWGRAFPRSDVEALRSAWHQLPPGPQTPSRAEPI